jgi:hypothetical protein
MTEAEKPADDGYWCQLYGASLSADPGNDDDAETKPDRFRVKCPGCGQWFDIARP